jgi:hypothetical protein
VPAVGSADEGFVEEGSSEENSTDEGPTEDGTIKDGSTEEMHVDEPPSVKRGAKVQDTHSKSTPATQPGAPVQEISVEVSVPVKRPSRGRGRRAHNGIGVESWEESSRESGEEAAVKESARIKQAFQARARRAKRVRADLPDQEVGSSAAREPTAEAPKKGAGPSASQVFCMPR